MTLPPLSPNAWLRYDVVQRLLPADVRSVLEVGCGQGALGARLAAGGLDYVGIEPDPVSATVAASRVAAVGRGTVRSLSVEALDPASTYDLVCAFEVLEHLADDRGALATWMRHIRPGGWLLLSTPADPDRYAAADELAGHHRRYLPAGLRTLLAGAGLVEVTVCRYGGPLGYLLETGRNSLARRQRAGAASMAARTGASGRWRQPSSGAHGVVTQVATAPFRALQRLAPDRGPGLVARGRRPSGAVSPDETGR